MSKNNKNKQKETVTKDVTMIDLSESSDEVINETMDELSKEIDIINKTSETTVVEETTTAVEVETTEKLDIEKFKLEAGESDLSSEEYIKEWLKNILNEVKNNNKLVFQWLFIMYLEDMLSKIR